MQVYSVRFLTRKNGNFQMSFCLYKSAKTPLPTSMFQSLTLVSFEMKHYMNFLGRASELPEKSNSKDRVLFRFGKPKKKSLTSTFLMPLEIKLHTYSASFESYQQ